MITSIFSKSKPINFLIVFVITALAFLIVKLKYIQEPVNWLFLVKQVLTFIGAYFSVLVLNFITSKNDLTQKNNFEIVLYSLFLLLLPESLISAHVIWANFFILLALRRLLSLRTKKNIKSKLYDAALLIGVASLFYFWSILFFILIPFILLFHANGNIKNWLIPFIGLLSVFVLCVSVSIVANNTYFGFLNIDYKTSFDFSTYNSLQFIVAATVMISFGLWAAFSFLTNVKKKTKSIRPAFKAIFSTLFIALILVIISPNKNGSAFLFLFTPLAIILTNYIEIIKEKWFKEVFFGVLLILPFALLMLHFFTKG